MDDNGVENEGSVTSCLARTRLVKTRLVLKTDDSDLENIYPYLETNFPLLETECPDFKHIMLV